MKKFLLILLFSNFAIGQTLSPDGMTQVMNGQDDKVTSITLGHTFPYYDGVFTNAWMSTNGFILLYDPVNSVGNQTTSSHGWCCNGYDLSNYNATDGRFSYMLAPMWTDLKDYNITTDDGYYYETGTGGSSFLWYDLKEYNKQSNNNTFQLDLWPDGSFDFIYEDAKITNHSTFIGFTGPYDGTTNDLKVDELLYKSRNEGGITLDHIELFASQGTSWYGQDGGYEITQTSSTTNSTTTEEETYEDTYIENITGQDYVYGDEVSDFYDVQTVEENFYFEEEISYADTGLDDTGFGQGDETGSYGETGPIWDDTEFQDESFATEEAEEIYGDSLPGSDPVLGGDPFTEVSEEIIVAEEVIVIEEIEIFEEDVAFEEEIAFEEEEIIIEEEPVVIQESEEVFVEEEIAVTSKPVAGPKVNAVAIALETVAVAQEKSVVTVAVNEDSTIVDTQTSFSDSSFSFGSIDDSFASATFDMIVDPTVAVSDVVIVESTAEQTTQEETIDFQMESSTPQMDTGFVAQQDQSFSTGQSITAVLNNVAPNFSQFDVAPPSAQEQQTTQRAETQASNMSDQQLANNLDEFTDEMQDSGGFSDQSLTIFLLGRVNGFDDYGGQLQDNPFYNDRGLPVSTVQNDRNIMLQLIGPSGKHEDMIAEQYR